MELSPLAFQCKKCNEPVRQKFNFEDECSVFIARTLKPSGNVRKKFVIVEFKFEVADVRSRRY